jgi:transposase InsO family protein
MSEVFKRICKLLKIEKIHTTAYHPESNGALERTHKTITICGFAIQRQTIGTNGYPSRVLPIIQPHIRLQNILHTRYCLEEPQTYLGNCKDIILMT